jgi:transposase
MSRGKRKNYSAEFKARAALEAFCGEQTLSELAAKYEVHPNLISKWKSEVSEALVAHFSNPQRNQTPEKEIDILHAKIGQLTMERDFLQKVFNRVKK